MPPMDGGDGLLDLVGRLRRQQEALVALARRHAELASDLDAALREMACVAATTLAVERASVWVLGSGGRELRCLVLFERGKSAYSSGTVLRASDYPRYFAALETGRAIPADDARSDPRTSEFRTGYLEPLGITSMMDAAVRDQGRVVGVVCHEHVGPMRVWTADEIAFAGAIGDQVSLVMATVERRLLEDERSRMQQQLLHAQKLESLGVLAGGLAHALNNLLGIVLANAGFARETIDREHPARSALDDIARAAERAASLARQLLAYSGRSPVVFQPVDLVTQVSQIAQLLGSSISKKVAIRLEPAVALPSIDADPAQVQQVAMNLLLNAAESIGDRVGQVRVTTAVRELSRDDVASLFYAPGISPGRHVALEVEDTGSGIDPARLSKIFDPFFTTKGSGRGLGLSAVIGIVRAHRGAMGVASTPGRGTTFRLYFPIGESAAGVAGPSGAARAELGGQGTILVIDDEELIGKVVGRILESKGFCALTATGARAGIEIFRAHPHEVRAALLDMTMPEMSGVEVFHQLRSINPSLKVILMSGYGEQEATKGLIDRGLAGFLQKPFSPAQLLDKLRDVLAS